MLFLLLGIPFISASFIERFSSLDWIPSRVSKYTGVWKLEAARENALPGDLGLAAKTPGAHSAISKKFKKALDPKNKPLVVQYEVKLQNGLECGGAYIKLLGKDFESERFDANTPYVIMFGPDRCGEVNKVHFIFKTFNPVKNVWQEHHLTTPPQAEYDTVTNLYTLVVYPDQRFEIRVNNYLTASGSLLTHFAPPVNPPQGN
jgi:calnexin